MDISFFAFDLPWYRFVLGFAFATVVVGLIAAAVTHYLYGGLRLQPRSASGPPRPRACTCRCCSARSCCSRRSAYWLDRYGLAVNEHHIGQADFTGLTYTDVNAVLPAKTILAIISLICAALFFANIVRRTWLLPGIGVGLLLLSALLVGGIYPALVQRFQVKPAEADKEAPYIKRNIDGDPRRPTASTRSTSRPTPPTTRRADQAQLRPDVRHHGEHPAARPAAAQPDVQEPAADQGLLRLPDASTSTATPSTARRRDVVMAVRELTWPACRPSSATGSTTTRVYTHGFGFVAALGNDDRRRPPVVRLLRHPADGRARGRVRAAHLLRRGVADVLHRRRRPRARRRASSTSPTTRRGSGQRNNTYTGKGGVAIGSLVAQAAVRDEVPGGEHPAVRPGELASRRSSTTATRRSGWRRSRRG